jgi:hypothetical protein
MIDIEFIVQFLVLQHAAAYPELTANFGNIALLRMCGELGLIDAGLAARVADAYRQYRKLQHQLRLQGQDLARIAPELVEHHAAQVPRYGKPSSALMLPINITFSKRAILRRQFHNIKEIEMRALIGAAAWASAAGLSGAVLAADKRNCGRGRGHGQRRWPWSSRTARRRPSPPSRTRPTPPSTTATCISMCTT